MKLALLIGAATGAAGASVSIEFEFYEATYEANAVDVWDYDYEDVAAHDSHNEWIDVCERIYITDDSDFINGAQGSNVQAQCCTPADRSALTDGCENVFEANGWSTDFMPESCDTYTDAPCAGIQTDTPAAFVGEYDACDYSYNCAEQVTFEALILDTTPPVIGCEVAADGSGCWWNEDVEKCTYFDTPELTAADDVDFDVDIGYSTTYGGTVVACSTSSSGQSCSGGEEVSDNAVDVDTPGTYCVQYDAFDDSGNTATSETFIIVVEDTTDPNLYLETEAITIECAVETCVPDASPSSDNVPCDDEPEVTYDNSDVDLDSVGHYDIVHSVNDGYNYVSATFSITIEDTTPPTITCPNDYVYEYLDSYNEGYSIVSDTCSDTTTSDDQYAVYPVEDGVVSEIGTYYATYDVVDAVGLTASCQQEVVIQDTTPPVCEFEGDEYITIEACTGEYTEFGVTCTDDYDDSVNDEVWCEGDCGAVDEFTVGTYAITYGVTDVNGNSATPLTRYVTVEDSTEPELELVGEAAVVLEASNPSHLEWTVGALCTDTCPQEGEDAGDADGVADDDVSCESYVLYQTGYLAADPGDDVDVFVEAIQSYVDTETSGYCSVEGSLVDISNSDSCGGGTGNIAQKMVVEFYVTEADVGEWSFDFNVDFGLGGVVYFDGEISSEGFQTGDHWWSSNYDVALPLDVTTVFDEGRHTMTVFGGEICCDGTGNVRYSSPTSDGWQYVTEDNLNEQASCTVSDDDSSANDDIGCADGTRDGFYDLDAFPNVAACAGTYSDNIDYGNDGGLCADGWSVCDGNSFYSLDISFSDASAFDGCFAYNSASDCNACYETCEGTTSVNGVDGCWDSSGGFDMDGVGSGCGYVTSSRTSCMADGMIRAADNAGCSWDSSADDSSATGLVCCRDESLYAEEAPAVAVNHGRNLLSHSTYDHEVSYEVDAIAYANHAQYTDEWSFGEDWYICADGSCDLAASDLGDLVVDEQQYYCGSGSTADMEDAIATAESAVPTGGDEDISEYMQGISDACGLYAVTYSCTDAVGNTATATQYIYVGDTIDPEIFTGEFSSMFSRFAGSGAAAGIAGAGLIAGVALVATKQRRSAYIPL